MKYIFFTLTALCLTSAIFSCESKTPYISLKNIWPHAKEVLGTSKASQLLCTKDFATESFSEDDIGVLCALSFAALVEKRAPQDIVNCIKNYLLPKIKKKHRNSYKLGKPFKYDSFSKKQIPHHKSLDRPIINQPHFYDAYRALVIPLLHFKPSNLVFYNLGNGTQYTVPIRVSQSTKAITIKKDASIRVFTISGWGYTYKPAFKYHNIIDGPLIDIVKTFHLNDINDSSHNKNDVNCTLF